MSDDSESRLASHGLKATWVYLFLLVGGIPLASYLGAIEIKQLGLNEVGDFLAGAFGPLAIFWLVLGFFQQGSELRNSILALNLQTKEFEKSVKAQSDLAKSSSAQIELQSRLRDADLWLEIRKAELDVRKNLTEIEPLLDAVERSRYGSLSAQGMFQSGAKEKFDNELLAIRSEFGAIQRAIEKTFPIPSYSEVKPLAEDAGLIYDLNTHSASLKDQLRSFLSEDRVQNQRRYEESLKFSGNPRTR